MKIFHNQFWALIVLMCFGVGAFSQTGTNTVSIEYIAHACFILEAEGKKIMIDPYADRVWLGYDFPKGIKVDAVFITHPHYDHDGGIFRGKRPDWMFNTPFYQHPSEYEIGAFKIKGIVGKHADPYGAEFGQMNTIWKITVGELTLAHWGDNAPLTDEISTQLQDIDILMIPMDGDFHIIPKEAYEEALNAIKPNIIIPMHYRIPELEKDDDSPSDLGEIGPFLELRPRMKSVKEEDDYLPAVRYLDSNLLTIDKLSLEEKSQYIVFKHSELIPKPD